MVCCLAVAAYNAGEGNVGKWLTRTGNRPTDEWVESIPFRETRGYVKRVLGTYQTYRVLYGVPNSAHNANGIQQVPAKSDKENNELANEDPLGPLFPDWQTTNHRVKSQSK